MKKTILSILLITQILGLTAQESDSLAASRQMDSLFQISRTLTDRQDFGKALEINAVAEDLAIEKFGKESIAYARCCFNHGRVLDFKGDFSGAEKRYLESIELFNNGPGNEHPDHVRSLANLGILNYHMGNYEKAEPLFLEAMAITENTSGKEQAMYARLLTNLADLYLAQGNFENAERLYLEAMIIMENATGNAHPSYARILNNLGILYFDMGNYEKAEPLYIKAIGIGEKTLGKEHPEFATRLNNLANLYYVMGHHEKAESLSLETKRIFEKTLGRAHPDYAQFLNNLAALYQAQGKFDSAETLYQQSLSIREKALGKRHPGYAQILSNLADLYSLKGNYDLAEPLYLEAKASFEKAEGKERLFYAHILGLMAGMYHGMGQLEKAELLYHEFSDVNQRLIAKAFRHLSEREMGKYLIKFSNNQNQLLSFAHQTGGERLVPTCFDNSLFYKGFLLHASVEVKRLALANPSAKEKFNELKALERRLAAQYALPSSERDSAGVSELEAKTNMLEKELARTISGFGDALRQVRWQEVQASLQSGEAAIEFVHYRLVGKEDTDSLVYAALLLKPGDKQPRFIRLFEEKSLDSLLHFKSERKADYVNHLYTLADRGAIAIEAPKKTLYELLWKPLEMELAGIKAIYFSPSGLLHRINLAAIPVSETETLADRFRLIELNSTRQLVIPTQIENSGNDALLYGGIQFDRDSNFITSESLVASRSIGALSFTSTDTTLRGGAWNYLAGTEREVNSVEKILQTAGVSTTLKMAYKATEESFKNIGVNSSPSPRILHMATHGYFFPDAKTNSQQSIVNGQSESVFKMSDHPMLRSGLILAGGNAAWRGNKIMEGREDGILTAYEISQMNLSNTELVVLSACETGLGDIQGNEGVYGLQRAFKIAGAKYIIMSLWQVPDKQTSLLMTTFYKHWLENKKSIPEAFHAAQKELRELGFDPYQWAGFVLVE